MVKRYLAALGLSAALLLATAGGVSAAKTKIIFWADSDPVTEKIVADFNKRSTNVEVEYQIESTSGALSQIADKVSVAIAAGAPPDVLIFNRPYASEWAAKGLLVELDPYLKALNIKRDQFIPFAWDEGTYKGRSYVLPIEADARAVFFNRTLLSQAGIDGADIPEDLDRFDNLAAKLTKMSPTGGYSQVGFIPWSGQGSYLFTWNPSFGGQLFDAAANKVTLNDPRNVRILEWMLGYSERYNYNLLKGSFTSGTLAMNVNTNTTIGSLNQVKGLEWGVTYMPAPADGVKRATYAGGFGIAIPSGAKHVREAAEFIAYFVSDEVQLMRAQAKGSFPATLRSVRDSFYSNDPNQRIFIDMLPNAQPRPNTPILGQLWDAIKSTTDRVLKNGESPRNVLDDVTRRMQALLDETLKK